MKKYIKLIKSRRKKNKKFIHVIWRRVSLNVDASPKTRDFILKGITFLVA